MPKYEFAIRKAVLSSGKTTYTPVCRKKTSITNLLIPNPWERIVKVYDDYILMDLPFTPNLTYQECEEHIIGYQNKLHSEKLEEEEDIQFEAVSEMEI
jgi:hypothetical protein